MGSTVSDILLISAPPQIPLLLPHCPLQNLGLTGPCLREAWRYTGPFTRIARFRGMFPGFGIASVAFGIYLGYEYLFLKDEHGHGHGDGRQGEPGTREGH